jgi:hypothetical protein
VKPLTPYKAFLKIMRKLGCIPHFWTICVHLGLLDGRQLILRIGLDVAGKIGISGPRSIYRVQITQSLLLGSKQSFIDGYRQSFESAAKEIPL